MKRFGIAGLQQKYGIRRAIITELVKIGLIEPGRGPHREYLFTFHDVVLLRMAQDLHATGIGPRRLARLLRQLDQALPNRPAAGMRVCAAGGELVVREDGRLRNVQGQLVLDFSHPEPAKERPVRLLERAEASPQDRAWALYVRAEGEAQSQPLQALHWYREAVEIAPDFEEAWINLSCLLIDNAQVIEAYAVCVEALARCPASALLHFNLAIVHEDMDQPEQALEQYQAALALDASLADAHFNLARLHEARGENHKAIRHYNAYRRFGHAPD